AGAGRVDASTADPPAWDPRASRARVIGGRSTDKGPATPSSPEGALGFIMNTFRNLTIVGGLCATGLLGCVLDAGPEAFDEGFEDAPLVERESVLSSACNRRVHILRDDTAPICANVGSWVGQQLFDVGTPWLDAVDVEPVPDE